MNSLQIELDKIYNQNDKLNKSLEDVNSMS